MHLPRPIEITLVRHTRPDVAPGTCYGRTDLLPDAGFEADAAQTLRELQQLDRVYDAVFTSPLRRCAMLAAACGYVDARPDSRLMEMNFGQWEMQPFDSIRDERLREWYDDWMHVAPTGGESCEEMQVRVADFLRELQAEAVEKISDSEPRDASDARPFRVLIFAHAGIAAQLRMLINGASPADAFASLLPFGAHETYLLR